MYCVSVMCNEFICHTAQPTEYHDGSHPEKNLFVYIKNFPHHCLRELDLIPEGKRNIA